VQTGPPKSDHANNGQHNGPPSSSGHGSNG
jgi:hypothetical protein